MIVLNASVSCFEVWNFLEASGYPLEVFKPPGLYSRKLENESHFSSQRSVFGAYLPETRQCKTLVPSTSVLFSPVNQNLRKIMKGDG